MVDVGATVDRYEIGPLLGEGGMGRVFRARDTRLERDVAFKVVKIADEGDGDEARRRVLREARAAAALDHPGAVAIFDTGEVEGTPYIVMELVEGTSLRAAMKTITDRRERARWLLEVARVMAAAHAKNLVHRDIKPENIMLRPDGAIRVLDFGIARRPRKPVDEGAITEDPVFATITEAGIPIGTPLYMAPEQIRGLPVDHRADQFSWGVMAYELMTGTPPWPPGESLPLVAAILTDEPEPLHRLAPELPPPMAQVIHRCLAKEPDARFGATSELVASLEAILGHGGDLSPSAPPPPAVVQVRPPRGDLSGYSVHELGEILERALLRQPPTPDAIDGSDLVEVARGMNVRETDLDEAAAHLSRVESPYEADQGGRRAFRIHAAIWAACAVFFVAINLFATPGEAWAQFPIVSWALGVAIHGIAHRFRGPPKPRPPNLRRRLGKLTGERQRTGLALEPAVRQLLAAADELRGEAEPEGVRIEALDSHLSWDARFAARRIDSREASPQVRFEAADTERHALAEAEVAEAEAEQARAER